MILEGIGDLEDVVWKIGEEVMDFEEELWVGEGNVRKFEWEKKSF